MTQYIPGDQPTNVVLAEHHYLGACSRARAVYEDEAGILVFSNPASRRLPQERWLELARWCILIKDRNAGSMQWSRVVAWLYERWAEVSTIVSYSDPSVGHTGALYRACNWLWAPTWHRLRPPPTGNGSWTDGRKQTVKDRWVFPLGEDTERASLLVLQDDALRRKYPFAEYREPRFWRGRPVGGTGGGDYKRWREDRP